MSAQIGWKSKRLTDLADYVNGYAFKPEDWGKDGLKIIRIEQLKNPNASSDYYFGKLPNNCIINDGDLLFSWSASLFLTIWRHGRAALNQHLFKVIERDGVNRIFLKHFIEFYLDELSKASHGSTMQHITRKELDRFSAPFPIDETEQTKIAEVLSTVDRAIDQTEALIAKQQRIKTGLMQDLLTRGIDKHGNLRTEETHEFKDSPLGRISVEWEAVTIDQLLNMHVLGGVQDGNHGEKHPKSRDFVEEGIPFVMASDISEGFVDVEKSKKITEQQYLGLRIGFSRPGDVLLSHKASIGFVAEVPDSIPCLMLTPQVTYYRIGDLSALLPSYLAQFFRSEVFQETLKGLAKQSTRDYIGILAQRKIHVAFPKEVSEQEMIVEIFSAQDKRRRNLLSVLNKHRLLKTALMQDLLTGKVRVIDLLTQPAAH